MRSDISLFILIDGMKRGVFTGVGLMITFLVAVWISIMPVELLMVLTKQD